MSLSSTLRSSMKIDLNNFQATLTESPTYNLQGMSCQGCATQVANHLNQLTQVKEASVDKSTDTFQLLLHDELPLSAINTALKSLDPKYLATLPITQQPGKAFVVEHDERSWIATYQPILLILAFLLLVTGTIQYQAGTFQLSVWMRHFMAGFFLVFSFFKLLNLKGFANSYRMYDIIAMRWSSWGYIYAFIELGLGIGYLTNFNPIITNSIALVVMSISIIGVLRTVLKRQRIQCACLGDVFNLPMSTVTIIEDGLMIVMSAYMLLQSL